MHSGPCVKLFVASFTCPVVPWRLLWLSGFSCLLSVPHAPLSSITLPGFALVCVSGPLVSLRGALGPPPWRLFPLCLACPSPCWRSDMSTTRRACALLVGGPCGPGLALRADGGFGLSLIHI